MHTWLGTQTEGWWRMALDKLGVPFAYISTQAVAREDNPRGKYDVILFVCRSCAGDRLRSSC